MRGLAFAISFLTVLPIRTAAPQPNELSRAAAWFQLVGLSLGMVLSLAYWLLSKIFAPALAAALTVALWAALTGGLHLDGLADCGDGLLSVASPERRLEIMRDPRLGAFGVISLVLFLILKVLAVAALSASPLWQFGLPSLSLAWRGLLPFGPLVLATVLSRWFMLIVARQPSARPGGMGQSFATGLTPRIVLLAAVLPAALTLFAGPRALAAVLLAAVVTLLILRLARAHLNGVTGDVYGLTVELTELTFLLTYAALTISNP